MARAQKHVAAEQGPTSEQRRLKQTMEESNVLDSQIKPNVSCNIKECSDNMHFHQNFVHETFISASKYRVILQHVTQSTINVVWNSVKVPVAVLLSVC